MARKINALIVDDSASTRRLIMAALKQTGLADFVFAEAQDGVEALDKYRPDRTQVIFVDMNMPRMTGVEFVRELRKRHTSPPPIVMITGESNVERLREAVQDAGVDALMLKPVDRDRLRAGLKSLVDSIPDAAGANRVPHAECLPLALQDVLARACDLKLTTVPENADIRAGEIVLSMMAIVGDVHWTIGLGFTRAAANGVANRFAGTNVPMDWADLGDAIGELSNIVGGRLRLLLSARDIHTKNSPPTVISASGLQILTARSLRATVTYTHFDSAVGQLWIGMTAGISGGIVL